ncbi:hypothetical protein PAECIP111893_01594 [Paenibacillus plantiphilus]|uniref:DUF3899 domain-containing protein n=1 Tax=Paenibacillus plantiphilus TaxID=2905650 RepID=A0ABN8G6B5_9BACL|nr:hypothetical protein [Paenibacillus plantiphilus]CAH1201381.1 hypothetical protein PAECIP111893_01594 [Paenibacillus plantiphilus]
MLGIAQKEYEYEVDRKKTLETRAGIFLAFIGVLFTLISRSIDTSMFSSFQGNHFVLYATIYGLFLLIPILLLLVSLYCFVHVIITKKYTRLELKDFNDTRAKLTEEESAVRNMKAYVKVVSTNTEKNDTKTKYFNTGVLCTAVAAVLIILLYIITFAI